MIEVVEFLTEPSEEAISFCCMCHPNDLAIEELEEEHTLEEELSFCCMCHPQES